MVMAALLAARLGARSLGSLTARARSSEHHERPRSERRAAKREREEGQSTARGRVLLVGGLLALVGAVAVSWWLITRNEDEVDADEREAITSDALAMAHDALLAEG